MDVLKVIAGLLCGAILGGIGVFAWLVWYFRDVYK